MKNNSFYRAKLSLLSVYSLFICSAAFSNPENLKPFITCTKGEQKIEIGSINAVNFSTKDFQFATEKMYGVATSEIPAAEAKKQNLVSTNDQLVDYIIDQDVRRGLKIERMVFPTVPLYNRQSDKILFVKLYLMEGKEDSEGIINDVFEIGVSYSSDAGKSYKTIYFKDKYCKFTPTEE